jgi:hypothetical protein
VTSIETDIVILRKYSDSGSKYWCDTNVIAIATLPAQGMLTALFRFVKIK